MTAFSIFLAFGAGLGLLEIYRSVARRQADRSVNAGLLVLLSGLVGARLWFVLLRSSYYSVHLGEIPQVWQGGLSWPGAAVGGLLALVILSLWWNTSLLALADGVAPALAPIAVLVWLGCWLGGSAYGAQVPAGTWWGISTRDETGLLALRWPLQPLASITLAAAFALLSFWKKKPGRPGWLASVSLLLLSLNLFAFSLLLAGPTPLWRGLRPETWAAGALGLIALIGLAASLLSVRRKWAGFPNRGADTTSAGSEH